ncbi:MAG: hypothetical protein IJY99_02490 [Alphaproteobacteria bacterium]|nr:hypothetical protein [Alphaproteobacteria bacterium]
MLLKRFFLAFCCVCACASGAFGSGEEFRIQKYEVKDEETLRKESMGYIQVSPEKIEQAIENSENILREQLNIANLGTGEWHKGAVSHLFETCTTDGYNACLKYYEKDGIDGAGRCLCVSKFIDTQTSVSTGFGLIENWLQTENFSELFTRYRNAYNAHVRAFAEYDSIFRSLDGYPLNMVTSNHYNSNDPTLFQRITSATYGLDKAETELADAIWHIRNNLHCSLGYETRYTIDAAPGDDYIKCVWSEPTETPDVYTNWHSLEFRFDDLTETMNSVDARSTAETVASLYFQNSKITGDVFRTDDRDLNYQQCSFLDEQLWGYSIDAEYKQIGSSSNAACWYKDQVIRGEANLHKGEELGLDIDTINMFANYQFGANQNVKMMLETILINKVGGATKRVRCAKRAAKYIPDDAIFDYKHVWPCYVAQESGNGEIQVDFIFDDLSENLGYETSAAKDVGACYTKNGDFDGKNCHGLDKNACAKIGARWDTALNTCVLENVENKQQIDNVIKKAETALKVGAVVASAVATGGTTLYILAAVTVVEVTAEEINTQKRNINTESMRQALSRINTCIKCNKKDSCTYSPETVVNNSETYCMELFEPHDSTSTYGKEHHAVQTIITLYSDNNYQLLDKDPNLRKSAENALKKIFCTPEGRKVMDEVEKNPERFHSKSDTNLSNALRAVSVAASLASTLFLFKGAGWLKALRNGNLSAASLPITTKSVLKAFQPSWTKVVSVDDINKIKKILGSIKESKTLLSDVKNLKGYVDKLNNMQKKVNAIKQISNDGPLYASPASMTVEKAKQFLEEVALLNEVFDVVKQFGCNATIQ